MLKGIVLSMVLIWLFYFWLDGSMDGSGPRGTGHRQS